MLHTASETTTRTRWPRRQIVAFLRSRALSPGPRVHAYRGGEGITLCSLPLDLLIWEQFRDVDFTRVPPADRCEACSALADRPEE
jgi:hypothetical protein